MLAPRHCFDLTGIADHIKFLDLGKLFSQRWVSQVWNRLPGLRSSGDVPPLVRQ